MTGPRAGFERRVQGALDAAPSRIPVVLGGCGTGRTWLLHHLRERSPRGTVQYVDVERCASTPERFLTALTSSSPFPWHGDHTPPATARAAFDSALQFLTTAPAPGGEPCTFLLDEATELRTFESFPGLRHVLRELLTALTASHNRFVLTTRYTARAHRLLRDATARYEVMHMPPLAAADVDDLLAVALPGFGQSPPADRDDLSRSVQVLADGRSSYAMAIGGMMAEMGRGADPISALTGLLAPDGALHHACRFCYELRLHRARGYGALKAILEILAAEEPLTLTEISLRLRRTPGSTKDYLSWLEDVDLVTSRQKRYSFADPLLRVWVRLHCRPTPPTTEEVAREVQQYAFARLPQAVAATPQENLPDAPVMAYAGAAGPEGDDRKPWGNSSIIEID
jgi:hypothetical protein